MAENTESQVLDIISQLKQLKEKKDTTIDVTEKERINQEISRLVDQLINIYNQNDATNVSVPNVNTIVNEDNYSSSYINNPVGENLPTGFDKNPPTGGARKSRKSRKAKKSRKARKSRK